MARWNRWWGGCASALMVLLVACGGGGGGGSGGGTGGGNDDGSTVKEPPSSAATLGSTGNDAVAAVQAAVSAGVTLAGQGNSAANLFLPTGDPFGVRGGNVLASVKTSGREQALDSQDIGCADFLGAPCLGSISIDSNFDLDSDTLPANSRLTLSFHGLAGTYGGVSVKLDGALRIDFLTAFDDADFANARLRVRTDEFRGTLDGVDFGPDTSAVLMEFDAQSRLTLTADGVRYSEMTGVQVDDADDFRIGGALLRRPHWSSATTYVDCRFTEWVFAVGRAALDSRATFTAGSDSIAIAVTESSAQRVVYRVTTSVGGATKVYVVTAVYESGTPAYTVVQEG